MSEINMNVHVNTINEGLTFRITELMKSNATHIHVNLE